MFLEFHPLSTFLLSLFCLISLFGRLSHPCWLDVVCFMCSMSFQVTSSSLESYFYTEKPFFSCPFIQQMSMLIYRERGMCIYLF